MKHYFYFPKPDPTREAWIGWRTGWRAASGAQVTIDPTAWRLVEVA